MTDQLEQEVQVVLVEDHLALRKGIELLLRSEGIRVVGVADNCAEGERMIRDRAPDVAVIDIGLDAGSGLGLARSILADDPAAGVLVYTGTRDPKLLQEALDAGARGCAVSAGSPAELVDAVRAVAAGNEYLDPRIADLVEPPDDASAKPLTSREREVMDLLAKGMKAEEIAEELVVSPLTVETHVKNVKNKLGARNRVHAVALALQQGQIAPE
jgi:two-component system invasion response regulator UvrY